MVWTKFLSKGFQKFFLDFPGELNYCYQAKNVVKIRDFLYKCLYKNGTKCNIKKVLDKNLYIGIYNMYAKFHNPNPNRKKQIEIMYKNLYSEKNAVNVDQGGLKIFWLLTIFFIKLTLYT